MCGEVVAAVVDGAFQLLTEHPERKTHSDREEELQELPCGWTRLDTSP